MAFQQQHHPNLTLRSTSFMGHISYSEPVSTDTAMPSSQNYLTPATHPSSIMTQTATLLVTAAASPATQGSSVSIPSFSSNSHLPYTPQHLALIGALAATAGFLLIFLIVCTSTVLVVLKFKLRKDPKTSKSSEQSGMVVEDYEVMTTGTDARKNVLADVTKTATGLSQKDDMGNNYKIISSDMAESYEVMTFKPAKSNYTSTSKLVGENDSLDTNDSVNDGRKLNGKTDADNPKDNLSCDSASSCNSETIVKVEISKV